MRATSAQLLGAVLLIAMSCQPPPTGDSKPKVQPRPDGYSDAPGEGAFFVFDRLAMATSEQCLDLDDNHTADCAINRAFAPMSLAVDNALQRDLAGGEYVFAIEIAGIDEDYAGDDEAVTTKLYDCNDKDNDPTNNFCGQPGCGQVYMPLGEMTDEGQTPYRAAIEPIVDHHLRAQLGSMLVIDSGGIDLALRRMHVAMRVPDDLGELVDGRLCGITRAYDLSHSAVPICQWLPLLCINPNVPEELSMAAYMVIIGEQPEIDLDGDGLERYEVDNRGQIARCTDGDGTVFEGANCLARPEIEDGFAFCLVFHGLPGELVDAPP